MANPQSRGRNRSTKSPDLARTQRALAKSLGAPPAGSAIESLLSGRTLRASVGEPHGGRKERAAERLPKEVAELADVLVAGRKIEREVSFKLEYAEKRVKDYCRRRMAELFAATGGRSSSMVFEGRRSSFTFIQTRRMSLTEEKARALDAMGVSIEGETELRGIRVNYEAIRRHKLEAKLRAALEGMNIPREVLAECFQPDVQFRETFFDRLGLVVERSLDGGERLAPKLYEVLKVLNPTEQIRNADLPELNSIQSYKLIHDAPVAEIGELEELDDSEAT